MTGFQPDPVRDRVPLYLSGSLAFDTYLELLKRILTRFGFDDDVHLESVLPLSRRGRAVSKVNGLLRPVRLQLAKIAVPVDLQARAVGLDWPRHGETMVGLARLDQLHQALHRVDIDQVPGDIVEAGIWRGGVVIFAAAYLQQSGNLQPRKVWAADSFEGLPKPDSRYPVDAGDKHHTIDFLKVSLSEVERNFERYNISRENVIFLKGWFEETLPSAPIDQVALLRLDGDMYSSTWHVLSSLYKKVSPGGYVVIDDFGHQGARAAFHDYFKEMEEKPVPVPIDQSAVYWRKV